MGTSIEELDSRALRRLGVAYCPQGSRVFSGLTVWENLVVSALVTRNPKLAAEEVLKGLEFQVLQDKRNVLAHRLSGGEKQLLSLACALSISPRLLLADEPALGMSPRGTSDVLNLITQAARDRGRAVVIVEQKVRAVLGVADRVMVLRRGRSTYLGAPRDLIRDDSRLRDVYL